jgi:hypothetical protein
LDGSAVTSKWTVTEWLVVVSSTIDAAEAEEFAAYEAGWNDWQKEVEDHGR